MSNGSKTPLARRPLHLCRRHRYLLILLLTLLSVTGSTATRASLAQSAERNRSVYLPIISQHFGTRTDDLDPPDQHADSGQLFVASLTPQEGTPSSASGLAAVRLTTEQLVGHINVSFSGLTSPQIAAHIHEKSTDNVVISLPLGQIQELKWELAAADPLPTKQATRDALMAGQLYINLHSKNHPDGEIWGQLLPAEGSIAMRPPNPPEAIEVLNGTDLKRDIARFLTQATFGPTPASVADLEARVEAHDGNRIEAYAAWLDEQMQIPSPSLFDYYSAANAMYIETDPESDQKSGYLPVGLAEGWFASSVYAKSQLRERMGFALSEIFVVSVEDTVLRHGAMGVANYYDMLRKNAFGSFQTLLTDVSMHPSMGWYLSHFQNQAELRNEDGEIIVSPDENYAREVLQLFTIGLVHLHLDGSLKLGKNGLPLRTYTQTDITELARVFTGWGMSVRSPEDGTVDAVIENDEFGFSRERPLNPYHPYWSRPMKMFEDNGRDPEHRKYVRYHDHAEKQILGTTIQAGLSGEEDLAQVMALLSHHPNTAPFISYRLIQRFVTSNPSADYIYRVATVFRETGGNLGEVLKAILLDPEARNFSFHEWAGYGKKKEPLVHFTAMLRLIEAKSVAAQSYPFARLQAYGLSQNEIERYTENVNQIFIETHRFKKSKIGFGQGPLRAPTVFNFFSPNYSPPGPVAGAALVAPELQLATENQVIGYYNTFYQLLLDEEGLRAGRPQALLEYAGTTYDIPSRLVDVYMDVMDDNADGKLTPADSAFHSEQSVSAAATALVNELDLFLCAGQLQAEATGDLGSDPHAILVNGVVLALKEFDHTDEADARYARNERIREALYLVGTAPDCLIQK